MLWDMLPYIYESLLMCSTFPIRMYVSISAAADSLTEVRDMLAAKPATAEANQKILLLGVQRIHSKLMERTKTAQADLKVLALVF